VLNRRLLRCLAQVIACSAATNYNMDAIWNCVVMFRNAMLQSGELQRRRARQQVSWMWKIVEDELKNSLMTHPSVQEHLGAVQDKVLAGDIAASVGASQLLELYHSSSSYAQHK
jgi:LAO/AO transport system kinase